MGEKKGSTVYQSKKIEKIRSRKVSMIFGSHHMTRNTACFTTSPELDLSPRLGFIRSKRCREIIYRDKLFKVVFPEVQIWSTWRYCAGC